MYAWIALAYLTAAMLGHLLALAFATGGEVWVPTPEVVSFFWPAAGVALVALLVHGTRAWPGIWIGGFLFNLGFAPTISGALLAASIAAGVTLQAFIGASLVRPILAVPTVLSRSRNVLRLLFFAGPLTCTVSASVGVAALWAAQRITVNELDTAWIFWWAGDSLGVLLVAPLALAAWQGTKREWMGAGRHLATPLLVTAVLLAGGGWTLNRLERQDAELTLDRSMHGTVEIGAGGVALAIASLRQFEALFAASEDVTPGDFSGFITPVLDQQALRSVEWLPRTAEPTADRNADLGIDRSRSPIERAVMVRAQETARPAAGFLTPDDGTTSTVILYLPIYRRDGASTHAGIAQQREDPLGFVRGLFGVEALLAPLAAEAVEHGLFHRVSDISSGDSARVLAGDLPEGADPRLSRDLEVADRIWRVEVTPDPAAIRVAATRHSMAYLVFFVLLGFMAAFATIGAAGRNAAIEAEVVARTRALRRELRARAAAEEALRESEACNRSIITSIRDPLAVLDLTGRLLGPDLGGRGPAGFGEAATGHAHDWIADWDACDREAARSAVARAAAGATTRFDGSTKRADESRKWWDVSVTPILGIDGHPERLLGIARDVSAQRQAETEIRSLNADLERRVAERTAQLHGQQEFSRLLLENLAEGVVVCDADARLILFNKIARQWHGLENADLAADAAAPEVWSSRYGLFEADGRTPVTPDRIPLVRALRGECLRDVEICIRMDRQSPRFVRVNGEAFHDAAGHRLGAIVTMYDETESRRNAGRLATLFSSSPDAIVLVDDDGRIVQINHQAEVLFGWSFGELAGQPVEMLIPAASRAAHVGLRRGYARQACPRSMGSATGLYLRGVNRDGGSFPVDISLTPIESEDGVLTAAVIRDVTEREHALRELQQAANDLKAANATVEHEREQLTERVTERTAQLTIAKSDAEQANRAKSSFLAAMSHEIRTPMNGVVGLLEILARGPLSDHQRDLVRTIDESAQVLLGIIDDILDFSKIEAGRMEIQDESVCVRELAEGVCSSLLPIAARKGVDVTLFVSPKMPERIQGDEVRFRQILYNLVGNAVKFSSGRPAIQGRVDVRATWSDSAPQRLVLSVADNGIGMTEQTTSRLFQPFTQAEGSTTRRFGGTGLGLTITKRLVDAMGGSLEVETAPDTGSCFRAEIPSVLSPEQPPRTVPDLSGVACVLLGDGGLALEDLRVMLQAAGATVHAASLPIEAASIAPTLPGTVVVVHALGHARVEPASLRTPFEGGSDLHHVMLSWGRRRRARVDASGVVVLDGDALRCRELLHAVEIAAGRAPAPEWVATPSEADEYRTEPHGPVQRDPARRILVAEDDSINQQVVREQLALLGYDAELAGDGAQALTMWRSGRYALLLTDLHMPELDGYALTKAIRADESGGPRKPIIALTANALRGEANRTRICGMDAYLSKPVQLDRLRATLEHWLPAATSKAPAAATDISPGAAGRRQLDLTVLEALVGNDPAILRGLLREFRVSTREGVCGLCEAASTGDAPGVLRAAHKLKSSSRAVGALTLGDCSANLERAATHSDWPEMERLSVMLKAVWNDTDTALGYDRRLTDPHPTEQGHADEDSPDRR